MERKLSDPKPNDLSQKEVNTTSELNGPVTPNPEKTRTQVRFLKRITASGRNNYERSRKTSGQREAIQQVQKLRFLNPQQAIGTQFEMSSPDLPATTPIFSTPKPAVPQEELSPGEVLSISMGIDPQVLEILAEEQNRVMASYHHLETTHLPSSPFAPRDTIEDDYSEESRP